VEKFPFVTAASHVLVVGEKHAACRKSTLFWMVLAKVPTRVLADSVEGSGGGSEGHGRLGALAVVVLLGSISDGEALSAGLG
jgi:hypothetical protein